MFLFVGGSATALQFVLLALFVEIVGLGYVLASATSYMVSSVYNYFLNYYVTFAGKQSHWVTLPKFVGVVAIGVMVNTLVFAAFLHYVPYMLAQVLAVGAALCVNYVLHKYWIYRRT